MAQGNAANTEFVVTQKHHLQQQQQQQLHTTEVKINQNNESIASLEGSD